MAASVLSATMPAMGAVLVVHPDRYNESCELHEPDGVITVGSWTLCAQLREA